VAKSVPTETNQSKKVLKKPDSPSKINLIENQPKTAVKAVAAPVATANTTKAAV